MDHEPQAMAVLMGLKNDGSNATRMGAHFGTLK